MCIRDSRQNVYTVRISPYKTEQQKSYGLSIVNRTGKSLFDYIEKSDPEAEFELQLSRLRQLGLVNTLMMRWIICFNLILYRNLSLALSWGQVAGLIKTGLTHGRRHQIFPWTRFLEWNSSSVSCDVVLWKFCSVLDPPPKLNTIHSPIH